MAEILANGWQLQITIPNAVTGGVYDLGADSVPTVSMTVTSKSWTVAGVETTSTRTVYGKAVLRKPYPDQLVKDEVVSGSDIVIKVVLNDYVYASETVSNVAVSAGFHTDSGPGGSGLPSGAINEAVANSSAAAYHTPGMAWLHHDFERVESATFTVKMVAAHKFAQQGQPIRAVKFIATDLHSNTVSSTVSTMSKEDFTVSGLSAPVFSADLDFSTLTQGDLITIDAILYPWIGNAFQLSADGNAHPHPNLAVMKVYNDRTGAMGKVYAYVDGIGGGTPAVNVDPGVAVLNPYSTIALAAAAIKAYNNANFSRNSAGGGIIRLESGTYSIPNIASSTVTDLPLTIESVSGPEATIIDDAGQSDCRGYLSARVIFKNITVKHSSESFTALWDNNSVLGGTNIMVFDHCKFVQNGGVLKTAFLYRGGRVYFVECYGDDVWQSMASGNVNKAVISLGCSGAFVSTGNYSAVGCKGEGIFKGGDSTRPTYLPPPNGSFLGWSFLLGYGNNYIVLPDNTVDSKGTFIVGNVLEKVTTGVGRPLSISADGVAVPSLNVVEMGNTVVGFRSNFLYNDIGTSPIAKDGVSSFSSHWEWNSKSDCYTTGNGARIGNWSVIYRVGSKFRAVETRAADGNLPGAGNWIGEVLAVGDALYVTSDYILDASYNGTGAGNGDYTPGPLTELPQIPAGETAYPYDLYGRVIPADGTAYVGAVQREQTSTETGAAMLLGY